VTVAPGDSFWVLAQHVEAQRLGHAPTNAQVVPVWQAMIAANAAQLVHPGNPNLIYPGQQFVIPPP
jgi:nucleoid-associated protein YgaU